MKQSRWPALVAVVCALCAGMYWRWQRSDESATYADSAESVGDRRYALRCEACAHEVEMPAAEYLRSLSLQGRGQGLACPRCKAPRLWKTGLAADADTAALDVSQYTTEAEVRRALREASYAASRLQTQLADPAISGNETEAVRIRGELMRYRAQEDKLDQRLSQFASDARRDQ